MEKSVLASKRGVVTHISVLDLVNVDELVQLIDAFGKQSSSWAWFEVPDSQRQ